ncbi:hypothetical protein QML37_29340 [Klebsiella pneumoniae]|uniref:hypothetical protein n=1 Tax=Klebsiella pneumoniae TaxID=573 RepID=UPI003A8130C2
MATSSQNKEGNSAVRPPLFDGTDYAYWKVRMSIFLQSMDWEVWNIVGEKYEAPSSNFSQWTNEEKKNASLNSKAMNALYCAVNKVEFNRISQCTSAHDIWHTLLVTHEGTSKVKESKIACLVHKFELFRMKPSETISDMITRLTDITNSLKALGKEYSQVDLVRKVLRSLTPEWERKTTAIEEANDLNTLSLENLVGNLMAYEVQLRDRLEEEPKKKALAFRVLSDSKNSDEENEEDIALMTRQFRNFLKRKRLQRRTKNGEIPTSNEVRCYNCKKLGHIKKDCPLLKIKPKEHFKKKKAFQACWDDSDSSSDEEEKEETANLCLMALEEEQVSKSEFDELLDTFEDLYSKYKHVCIKNKELRSENSELNSKKNELLLEINNLKKKNSTQGLEIESIKSRFDVLQNEIKVLKEKTLDAQTIVRKFTIGRGKLDLILTSQKNSLNKTGLGFKQGVFKPKEFQNNFRNKFSNKPKNNKVFHAFKYSYNTSHFYRNNAYRKPKSKWIWVPKTNLEPENKKGSNITLSNSNVGYTSKQMDIGQRVFQAHDWKRGSILFTPK